VCPYAGWIQLGKRQNLCEFSDRFKKSDFLNEASKMSQEEKNLQIKQVLFAFDHRFYLLKKEKENSKRKDRFACEHYFRAHRSKKKID